MNIIKVTNFDALEDENNPKRKKTDFSYSFDSYSDFSYSVSYPSRGSQTELYSFGSETLHSTASSNTVPRAEESENASNIYTTTVANESNATRKNRSEGIIFSRKVNSSEDLDTPSGNTKKQLYECGKEGKAFQPTTADHEFRDRSPTVARPQRCYFGKSSNLSKPIHTGSKSFTCTECGKSFARNDHLRVHFRIHTGEKPYSCGACGKCFAAKSSLNNHVRAHTGDKPYRCTECGKYFALKKTLSVHFLTHTGEKPFSCGECGKCFAGSSNLSRHIRSIHTGERPYACNKCSKKYATNYYLKRHMLLHTREEGTKCDSCGAEFSSEDSLTAHKCRKNE